MGLNSPKRASTLKSNLPGIVPRKRLFDMLDRASQSLYWVTSPPGSGKTTFVNSYLACSQGINILYKLSASDEDPANFFQWYGDIINYTLEQSSTNWPKFTPEYSMGLEAFSRRFFIELYSRLSGIFTLVFDDHHILPDATNFNQILMAAINSLPENGQIIIISREAYPPEFARLQINQILLQIDWNDLKFTRSESEIFLKSKGMHDKNEIEAIQKQAQGWVSGMILLASSKNRLSSCEGSPVIAMHNEGYELMFDYFIAEIFDCYEESDQTFLMRVSLLKYITPLSAAQLCDVSPDQAEAILENLFSKNYFTNVSIFGEKFYEFHPLFRGFLIAQLEKMLTRNELSELKVKTGDILYSSGNINEAADMWLVTESWPGLSKLCIEQARSFFDAGRNRTLLAWVSRIPSEYLQEQPWLRYWQARCLSPYNQDEAASILSLVYDDFKKTGDIEGQYLVLAAAANIYMYDATEYSSSDSWMQAVIELKRDHPIILNDEINLDLVSGLLACILWRKGSVTEFPWVLELSTELLHKTTDSNRLIGLGFGLIWFHLYQGSRQESQDVVKLLESKVEYNKLQPLNAIKWHSILANYCYYTGGSAEQILNHASVAKEISEVNGIYFVNAMIFLMEVYAGLLVNDKQMAEKGINALWEYVCPGKRQEVFYYYVTAWSVLICGDYEQANLDLEKSSRLSHRLGMEKTVMQGFIYFLQGLTKIHLNLYAEVLGCMAALEKITLSSGSNLLKWKLLTLKAYRSCHLNELSMLEHIEAAIVFGKKNNLIRFHAHISDILCELYVVALENEIETEYVNSLIRIQKIAPNLKGRLLLQWPWQIKIFTLGRFKVVHEENALEFSGKQQRRPLELLKLLIAENGRMLKVREVVERLWPDVDADSGEKNFKTTLARLRKLVCKEAVILSEGKLSINKKMVWVDAWVVWELIEEIKKKSRRSEYNSADFKQLTLLYTGDFLKGDDVLYWISAYGETLKEKYLDVIGLYTVHLLHIKNREAAITVANQALDNDCLRENFYRIIMRAQLELGEYAEAVRTYRKCQKILLERLAIEPSAETKRLMASVMKSAV